VAVTVCAVVGVDHQLAIHAIEGDETVRLTGTLPTLGATDAATAAWWGQPPVREAWSWPTWSPDGRWVAAFATRPDDDAADAVRVVAIARDGVREVVWGEMTGSVPLYLQWHPLGTAIAVLSQTQGELAAIVFRGDRLGAGRTVETGVPLYFNWSPGGERLFVHAGEPAAPGRLVARDVLGDGDDAVMPRPPGNFCAPVYAGDRAVYAVADPDTDRSEVVTSRPDGEDARTLARHAGLVAVLAAPGRPWVAVASSPHGARGTYAGIDLVHLYTDETVRLTDMACVAFFWLPGTTDLLVATIDDPAAWAHEAERGQTVTLWKVTPGGGDRVHLATFAPTRDTLYHLRYFEQFADSHPMVSPDGRWLVYAGYPWSDGMADLSQGPRIWRKDLHQPHDPPCAIASGVFAVFPRKD
jgi:hypothetical protein